MALLVLWSGLTLRQQVLYAELTQARMIPDLTEKVVLPQSASLATVDVIMPALTTIPYLFPCLAALYLAGLVVMLLRLSGGIRQLIVIRTKNLEVPDDTFYALLHSLKLKLKLRHRVRLFITTRSKVPMVIGSSTTLMSGVRPASRAVR